MFRAAWPHPDCQHSSSCLTFFRPGCFGSGPSWQLLAPGSVLRVERVSVPDAWQVVAAAAAEAFVAGAVAAAVVAGERGYAFSMLERPVGAGSIAPEAFAVGVCCPAQTGNFGFELAGRLGDPRCCFCG